jgi:serine/threonine-protein kinase RsbW
MTNRDKRIEITLESVVESVDLAEEVTLRVARAAGFDEEDRHKIGMSVRESVINAYTYGNRENRAKKILLTLEFLPDRLVIHILDQGTGFRLEDVPDPLAEENLLRSHGRGILLMRAFMDEFDVRPGRQGGAEVIMSKRYPAARADQAGTRSGGEKQEE